jgi:CobQ-like glutamine amidotransferase family enzyme
MNIYGDNGNVLTLSRRLEWYGYSPNVLSHHPAKPFPKDVDIITGGGGQDSGQLKVQADLQNISKQLHELADDGTPMLMICGLYQLFGRHFKTIDGQIIKGIGIFAAETNAGPTRLVGNVAADTALGQLLGYENHSGQTFLDDTSQALGKVIKGAGNNGQDDTEGAIYNNVYGSYLHGSLLPKNPHLADELIQKAVQRRYREDIPTGNIDDRFADKARTIAANRPR